MLYLMMCQGKEKNMVKVGLTQDRSCERRRKEYRTHNPLAIMRSRCAGTNGAEKDARAFLTEKGGVREEGSEWFCVSDEVFDNLYKQGLGYVFPKVKNIYFEEDF